MKKLLFVFNPHSGTGAIGKHLLQVLDIFTRAGYEVVAHPTQAPRDAVEKILREGQRFDRIVSAGGDGMLHELINGILRLPAPVDVGYIPMGTVNDFAFSTKIPRTVPEAAALAVADSVRRLDVGRFGQTYFAYVAAFGIATNASYDTDQKAKNRWGFLAYVSNALKGIELSNLGANCREMTIRTPEQELEGSFIFGSVSNTHSIGGMTNLVAKDVVLDDGLMEGLFIRLPRNLHELDGLRNSLMARNFDSPCMHFIRSNRFEIQSEATAWTLDGERGGTHTQVEITTCPRALSIALPEEV